MSDILLKFLFHFEDKVLSVYTFDHSVHGSSVPWVVTYLKVTPPHTHIFNFNWKISDLMNFNPIHVK